METLYLNIENGSWIHIDSIVLLNIIRKTQLVLVLDFTELCKCLWIIHILFQLAHL